MINRKSLKQEAIEMKLKTIKDYEFDYHNELSKLTVEESPLWKLLRQVTTAQSSAIESYLKLRIRKKPYYLPNFLWKFILSRLVYVQYFNNRS